MYKVRQANNIFTKMQKKIAKAKHKVSERNNPFLFKENQVALATEIVTIASKEAPRWGGFKFKHDGMTYHFKK
jgi:hypothetical protein